MIDQTTTDTVINGAIPSVKDSRDHVYIAKTTTQPVSSGLFSSLLKALLNLFSLSWWKSLFSGGTYSPSSTTLPTSFSCDISKLPPAFNQLEMDCVANGLAVMMLQAGTIMPSRLALWWGAREIAGTQTQDVGVNIKDVFKTAVIGVPSEIEWPYDKTKWMDEPPSLHTVSISEYKAVSQTQHDIMDAIYNGFLVGIGFTMHKSFMTLWTDHTNILIPMPTSSDPVMGGHFGVLVGYTPDYVIMRNSFGPKWGQVGYCHLPWAFVLDYIVTTDLWVISK
jgi:hypothetical protein